MFHVVPSLKAALRAVDAGVDGLVVEGGEGGGFKNPRDVATMVLLPLVCERTKVPVIAAGGMVDGRTMAAAFALGAEGIQMGTRMVSAAESPVHNNWKKMILEAQETDTVFLNRFGPGPALRALRTEKTTRYEKEPPENIMGEFASALALYFGGDMEASIALSGQVAGRIDEIKPVAQIIRETIAEFHEVCGRIGANYGLGDQARERQCVRCRFAQSRVVEDAPALCAGHGAQPVRQSLKIGLFVSRIIHARRPVQADINKTRPPGGQSRGLYRRRIGSHTRDLEMLKHIFTSAPNQLGCRGSMATSPSKRVRNRSKKVFANSASERKARRQLNQQWPLPVAERAHLRKEGIQRIVHIAQTSLMRDLTRNLDREAEVLRHALCPPGIGRGLVWPVEGRVDLHRIEPRRIPRQMARAFAEQHPGLGTQRPACRSNENLAIGFCAHAQQAPARRIRSSSSARPGRARAGSTPPSGQSLPLGPELCARAHHLSSTGEAGEGKHPRCKFTHAQPQRLRGLAPKTAGRQLAVHSRNVLGDVG